MNVRGDNATKYTFLKLKTFPLNIIKTVDFVSINAIINYLIIYLSFFGIFVSGRFEMDDWPFDDFINSNENRPTALCSHYIEVNLFNVLIDLALSIFYWIQYKNK